MSPSEFATAMRPHIGPSKRAAFFVAGTWFAFLLASAGIDISRHVGVDPLPAQAGLVIALVAMVAASVEFMRRFRRAGQAAGLLRQS